MPTVEIDPGTRQPLIIGATGLDAIRQNIRMILLTHIYSIPLMRGFAHDGSILDSPAPLETARLTGKIIKAIEKYEPRVKVKKLEWLYTDKQGQLMEGGLTPKITFSLRESAHV